MLFSFGRNPAKKAVMLALVAVLVLATMFTALLQTPAQAEASEALVDEQDLEFREAMGLETDVDAVREIVNEPANQQSIDEYGVALTDQEVAEIERRITIQEKHAPKVEAQAKKTLGKQRFAGMYIDQQAGGVLKVGVVGNATPASLSKHVIDAVPASVDVEYFQADHSLSKLERTHQAVNQGMKSLDQEGVTVVSVETDVKENVVRVGVKDLDKQAESRLKDRFGSSVLKVVEGDFADPARTTWRGYLEAGLQIQSSSGICTSNIAARSGSNYYLISAAHCGGIGTAFTQGGQSIGSVALRNYGNNADVLAIRIPASYATNWLYINSTRQGSITSVQSTSGDRVGEAVCKSGRTTGVTCGQITSTNYTTRFSDGAVHYRQRQATFYAQPGDSGGPVYYGSQSKGIVSAIDSRGYSYYSHIGYGLSELGLTAITN
ncbi:S1 family peptidase [Desmospora profundinema]|uniref:Streptogrisin C n=1 Tax=Desmospora profundinema TaxID=1571184 RepID=A0ABU1IR72_9BACL|nr:S1 family peptidase [Desmospora profundinema]MDR6227285.1 streptogrisin C [Desmospora profundinema]